MAKAFKLPKKIGGVKVPKHLRKSSKSLAGFLESPLGREVIAAALTAMAGVLASNRQAREAVADTGRDVGHAGSKAAGAVGTVARTVAEAAIGAVADAVQGSGESAKTTPRPAKRPPGNLPQPH